MRSNYKKLYLNNDAYEELEKAKQLFRKHHPELDGQYLSNSYFIYQICNFWNRTG